MLIKVQWSSQLRKPLFLLVSLWGFGYSGCKFKEMVVLWSIKGKGNMPWRHNKEPLTSTAPTNSTRVTIVSWVHKDRFVQLCLEQEIKEVEEVEEHTFLQRKNIPNSDILNEVEEWVQDHCTPELETLNTSGWWRLIACLRLLLVRPCIG